MRDTTGSTYPEGTVDLDFVLSSTSTTKVLVEGSRGELMEF